MFFTFDCPATTTIPSYYIGSGRYQQVDTARKNAIGSALVDLVNGIKYPLRNTTEM